MTMTIEYYKGNEVEWDSFINRSMNGTFLQTRRFINYHPQDRFEDASLCIRKGNELVAAILGCAISGDDKTFFAHKGTTFGGITISEKVYSASAVEEIFCTMEEFLKREGFSTAYFKMVPRIYQKINCDLLDYFFYKHGYSRFDELNYYMDLARYNENIISQFSSSKRRDYRYSLKNDLVFKKLDTKEEIADFYRVLQLNLKKLGLSSVHSLEDLYDLKFNRFNANIEFYGVFKDSVMIAGSMAFLFDDRVFHTQYLSSDEKYLKLYPMDFLITNLIEVAVSKNMKVFSFGICTEDQGRYLNFGLSRFKEGFGTEYCINRSYEKKLMLV